MCDYEESMFYRYVLRLLKESGHVFSSSPIYVNHDSQEVMYNDSEFGYDVLLNRAERETVAQTHSISCLTTLCHDAERPEECIGIYSYAIRVTKNIRSESVVSSHTVLHKFWGCPYSLAFVQHDNHFILSMLDRNGRETLSDWYPLDCFSDFVQRMDIASISVCNTREYFSDIVYATARWYYLSPISAEYGSYELFPLSVLADSLERDSLDIDRDELKQTVHDTIYAAEKEYGDDYVELREATSSSSYDLSAEIDMLGFELEFADESLGEVDDEDYYLDDDSDEERHDEYEFDDLDPELFTDPTLLVKWLEQNT